MPPNLGCQLIVLRPLNWLVSDFGGTPRSGVKTQGGETVAVPYKREGREAEPPASPHRHETIFIPKFQPLTSLTSNACL